MPTHRRLLSLVADDSPIELVLQAIDQAAAPQPKQACLHPDCTKRCLWTNRQGRPALFCSLRCRRMFGAARAGLVAELSLLESTRARSASLSADQARQLDQAISIRRWELRRYPDLTDRT